MEESSITKLVSIKLKNFKVDDFDTLKPSQQSQLIKIETYFQICNEHYENALQYLSKIDLTIRGICKEAEVGKSTVYNSPDTLLKYIEKRTEELECNNEFIVSGKLKGMEDEIKNQQALIDNLIVDNIEYMNQKMLIENLKKENERLLKQREIHNKEKSDLIKKNNELSIELRKVKNNIIEFPSN